MTERLYRDDPYLLEFDATVLDHRTHDGRPAVILDRTAFYPEAGGQPWDTGRLDRARVTAVLETGGEVLHLLDASVDGSVHGSVDAVRRRDHREQHHGQHLLSRAFVEVASASTLSFHLGERLSTIDLDRDVGAEEVERAETRVNEVVWEARPVRVRTVRAEEAVRLGVRVPAGAGDAVRLVEAEGFDLQACGGTHPRTTAEVGVVLVLGAERYKGGSRVRFVCGHRAIDAARRRSHVLDRVGALLSADLEGLPDAASGLLDKLRETEKRLRALRAQSLEATARSLLEKDPARPALVVASLDGWAPDELRGLALQVTALAPAVALLGSRAEKAHLVFAQSPGLGHDLPAVLGEAVALLEGRGGGRGDVVQGGGPRLDRVDAALDRAAARVRPPRA